MKIRAVENFNIANCASDHADPCLWFRRSIVRKIWGDPDLVLLIFPIRLKVD